MPKKYTDDFLEEAYNYMQNNNLGITAVARHFKVDLNTLSKRLKEKYDNVISRKDGKLDINSNFFEIIDTEEKAYWLGFLTADGYISEDNKHVIELALKESDKNHIEKFKKALDSQHKIGKKQVSLNNKKYIAYRINIRDKKLNNDLRLLGLTSNKSYDSNIPFDYIPKHLINHYIRGLFDGDGSVYKSQNRTMIHICTTASDQMVSDITKCILEELNIQVKYQNKDHITNICLYKQADVKAFSNWIYKDYSVCLERKYNLLAVLNENHNEVQDN